ncbi:hypothetical protein GC176_16245 [bacterium]|nr:hypothetical protein [bacterium]
MTGILLAVLIAVPATGALALPDRSIDTLQRLRQAAVLLGLCLSLGWIVSVAFGFFPAKALIEIAPLVELETGRAELSLSVVVSSVRMGLLVCGLLTLLPPALSSLSVAEVLPRPVFASDAQRGNDATAATVAGDELRLSLGVLSAGSVAMLSGDLVVLAAAWLLLDTLLIRFADLQVAAPRSADSDASNRTGQPARRAPLLNLLRLSSVTLLAAILLAATRYHTTSLPQFVEAAATDAHTDAAIIRNGILVWFALAVAGRAALFPASVWLRSLTDSPSRETLPVVVWATLLPAVGLWLSLTPLLPFGVESCLLIAALSGLSGVMLGAIAIALPAANTEGTPLLLLAMVASLALLSVSVSALSARTLMTDAALLALLTLLSGSAAVCLMTGPGRSRTGMIIAALFLSSGLGGPNALLDTLQALRRNVSMAAEPAGSGDLANASGPLIDSGMIAVLWCAVCATQFLIGAIVVRRLLADVPLSANDKRRRLLSSENRSSGAGGIGPDFVASTVFILASGACFGLAWIESFSVGLETLGAAGRISGGALRQLLSFNAATPAGLLGGVCVWLFQRAPVAIRARLQRAWATPERLAQNWFYSGDIAARLRLPLSWAAWTAEAVDRRILGGSREDSWRPGADRVGRSIEDLEANGTAYPGLAALLAIAGLLLALAGFGR